MQCLPEVKLCANDFNFCIYRVIISVEHWPTIPMSPYLKLQSSHCTYKYMKVLKASFLVHSTPQSVQMSVISHSHTLIYSWHLLTCSSIEITIHHLYTKDAECGALCITQRTQTLTKILGMFHMNWVLAKITQFMFIILFMATLASIEIGKFVLILHGGRYVI